MENNKTKDIEAKTFEAVKKETMTANTTKTPVYLRDLTPECQEQWRKDFPNTLYIAEEQGYEIIVGYYEKNPKVQK